MRADRDPFDILRDHDTVDPEELPRADSPAARALFERITATQRIPRPPRRRRRLIIAVAILATAAVAATTWVALVRDITEPRVVCYASQNLVGDRVGIRPPGAPTVDLCAAPWTEGILTNVAVRPGEIPALTGCVTDTGVLAVFPTDDAAICERLGLATPTPSVPSDGVNPVFMAKNEIVGYFSNEQCATLTEASTRVRIILDDHGLREWTITTQPPHPQRPCASFAYDTDTQTVILIPIPRPPENND
ncbi:MAG: hypothetical protein ACC683_04950 [Acidimicrobiia bacterium]